MRSVRSYLYASLAPLLRRIFHDSIVGKQIKGTSARLYYDRSQHLGFLFARQIEYEREFSAIIMEHIFSGNLVFEIGSNIGQYSLQIAKKIGDHGKLICVEPDSDNFAFLSFNVLKNKCTNVSLVNAAVADQEGQTIFYKDTMTGGRMGSLIREYSGTHFQGESEEVRTTTLKNLINQYGIPDFIKVDVEGAEDLVFAESSSICMNTKYLIEVREETKVSIFQLFHSNGFAVFILEGGLHQAQQASDIPEFANLLIKKIPEP
jgi:FkbM family methyltransferase